MICVSPISIKDPRQSRGSIRITVPCGKCGSCRHNRRVDWSFRLKHEFFSSTSAFFITLTYDDTNVPYSDGFTQTLCKRDLQLFNKRIRKAHSAISNDQYRYYAVGEYGSKTFRPHYHIIAFNLAPVLVDNLSLFWKLGSSHVGSVNEASIHYITKYHVNFRKDFDDKEPEFAIMSRKPGIGLSYLSDDVINYHRDGDFFHVTNNGFKQRMPRYYKDKLFSKDEISAAGEHMRFLIESKSSSERERLLSLGIDDPDFYADYSRFLSAQRVLDKAQDDDRL